MAEKLNRVLRHTRAAVEELAHAGPQAPADVARKLGIPRPSAYRLLAALAHEELVTQTADGRFELSPSWLRFGDAALAAASAGFHRDDLLEQLRDETGLTVFLSVPRDDRTICVRRLHGRSYNILVLRPGGSLPFHLGGVGRASLAFGATDVESYLAEAPFDAMTPYSLTTRADLEADIAKTRADGVTLSDQDVTIGVAALAAPVMGDGRILAAVSIAGVREDVLGDLERLSAQLRRYAHEMSE